MLTISPLIPSAHGRAHEPVAPLYRRNTLNTHPHQHTAHPENRLAPKHTTRRIHTHTHTQRTQNTDLHPLTARAEYTLTQHTQNSHPHTTHAEYTLTTPHSARKLQTNTHTQYMQNTQSHTAHEEYTLPPKHSTRIIPTHTHTLHGQNTQSHTAHAEYTLTPTHQNTHKHTAQTSGDRETSHIRMCFCVMYFVFIQLFHYGRSRLIYGSSENRGCSKIIIS